VEILLSVFIKLGVISLLGVSPGAVLAFELILNGMAMFNHANLALPLPVDAVLRAVVVTPDVHRVHHSVLPAEANSNFGFNLVIWDRMFGTWRASPLAGHVAMEIGDRQVTEDDELRLDRMLTQPARIGT
jgi:sterol desaturase/sphingolipid hydroxylase (fatty acid hydroxylase superfamily)